MPAEASGEGRHIAPPIRVVHPPHVVVEDLLRRVALLDRPRWQCLEYPSLLILDRGPYRALPHEPLEFVGSSREDLRSFPSEARRAAGFELSFVQQGLAIKEVGSGAMEIRIRARGEWRVVYVAKFADAVYVLHAFQKKTRKTRREDIELARGRYREIGGRR